MKSPITTTSAINACWVCAVARARRSGASRSAAVLKSLYIGYLLVRATMYASR